MMKRVAILVLAAVALGLYVGVFRGDDRSPEPALSVAVSAIPAECLSGTFLPGRRALKIPGEAPPRDWQTIEDAPGAMPADRAAVELTIHPNDGLRKITLTGMKFKREELVHPPVAMVFYRPCKRHLTGRAIETDLDTSRVRILTSKGGGPGRIGTGLRFRKPFEQTRFPWTVSLDKPLHLYVLVGTDTGYYKWTARLLWSGGATRGAIPITDHGGKFRLTDTLGLQWWASDGQGRWVSVRGLAE